MFAEKSVESNRIVYTPSAFAKNNLLYLQETGNLKALKNHASTRSTLSSYLFFIVLEGSGTFQYNGQTYDLDTGDCVLIDCMKRYTHKTGSDLWKLQWVHFNGAAMPNIYNKYLEQGGRPVFHTQDPESCTAMLDQIYNFANAEDYLRDMRIHEKLTTLVTRIMELNRRQIDSNDPAQNDTKGFSIQDVKHYLDENWSKKITLDGLADAFYINKFYLTRLFKNRYGTPILTYVLNTRITHAKQLLRFSDDTIENISKTCGFTDQNYFSRIFKKIVGITPSEYRRKWVG